MNVSIPGDPITVIHLKPHGPAFQVKKDEFKNLLSSTFQNLNGLTDTKGREYAGDADQLANFKRLAGQLGMDPQKICMVYFQKHLDSINTFVKDGYESCEPIEGRIDDAILYLVLLKALILE